jgi:hypothetical protein
MLRVETGLYAKGNIIVTSFQVASDAMSGMLCTWEGEKICNSSSLRRGLMELHCIRSFIQAHVSVSDT